MESPDTSENRHRLFPSVRLFMVVLGLISGAVIAGGFAAFNFAIVCMVNETAIAPPTSGSMDGAPNVSAASVCGVSRLDSSSELAGGYDGEFAWDKATQSYLLAGHAFGGVIFALPSGLLSDRYGSKYVIAACILANAIANALSPVAAYAGVNWLFAVRMLQGVGQGALWPSLMAMVSTWATQSETGTLLTMAAVGYQLGFLLAMATTGVICGSSFRWPLTFYLWTGINTAFLAIWLVLYTDDPKRCRFISKRELSLLQKSNMRQGRFRQSLWRAPWKHVLFSPRALAIYVCQFSSTFATYYIAEFMPTYSKEVLNFDVRSNGIMSALPALSQCLARSVFGPLGDRITFCSRSKTFSVKFFTFVCALLPAFCFLVLAFLDCRHQVLAVTAFCLASVFLSSSTVGYNRAGILIAAQYSGLIGAFTNIYAFISAIIMPYIVGAIVKHGTVSEWSYSAFLVSGVMALSYVQFQIFGTAEQQDWAKEKEEDRNKVYAIDGQRSKELK